MRIYFDNAATTPVSQEVVEAMLPYLTGIQGNPSSIHADGRQARAAVEKARRHIAQHIGASIGEIFFTSGGTESNNMALKCAVRDLGVTHIISSPTEHHCVLHTLAALERDGKVEVTLLKVDGNGRINYAELEALLDDSDKKTLVSLMYANNEIGTLLDFDRVASLCAEKGALFHSDTVQAVGQFPIDVSKTPVSFLAGSAHKFHGPKGVGFIYINSENMIRPYVDGGSQERNMRGGTENVHGIVGMAKAFDRACEQMEARRLHIDGIRQHMKERLSECFEGLVFNGCQERYLHKVLSVSLPPSDKGDMLVMLLDMAGVSVSGGSACSSGVEQGSHVIAAIQGADSASKTLRFSFSHHNTKGEVDAVVERMEEVLLGVVKK